MVKMTQIRIKDLDNYYQLRAKSLIDLLFDNSLLSETITRSQMQIIENYVADEYQSIHDSTERIFSLLNESKGAKNV